MMGLGWAGVVRVGLIQLERDMDADELTSEQLWELGRNPEFLKLLTDEQRAQVEALKRAYFEACSAEEFATAAADTARRNLFAQTARLVEAARKDPAALEQSGGPLHDAMRGRIKRLIDEGGEVTDEFVAELAELQAKIQGAPNAEPPAEAGEP